MSISHALAVVVVLIASGFTGAFATEGDPNPKRSEENVNEFGVCSESVFLPPSIIEPLQLFVETKLNADLGSLAIGQSVTFASGESFQLRSLLSRRGGVNIFDIGNGFAVHILDFGGMRIGGSSADHDIYVEHIRRNRSMFESSKTLIPKDINTIVVTKLGELDQFIVSNTFSPRNFSLGEFLGLRRIEPFSPALSMLKNISNETRNKISAELLEFADKAALFSSFGEINILDHLLYTSDRGWVLTRWGAVDTIETNPNALAATVFTGEWDASAHMFSEEAYFINRMLRFDDLHVKAKVNVFAAELFDQIWKTTTKKRQEKIRPSKNKITEFVSGMIGSINRFLEDQIPVSEEDFAKGVMTLDPKLIQAHLQSLDLERVQGYLHDSFIYHMRAIPITSDQASNDFEEDLADLQAQDIPTPDLVFQVRQFGKRGGYPQVISDPQKYADQGTRLEEKLGVPVVPFFLNAAKNAVIEPRFDGPFLTLEDVLFKVIMAQAEDRKDWVRVVNDLEVFARKTFMVANLEGFNAADVIYLKGYGWMLRNWNGKLREFSLRSKLPFAREATEAEKDWTARENRQGSLFSDRLLVKSGFKGGVESPYFPEGDPARLEKAKGLLKWLRTTVEKEREHQFGAPCQVTD